MFVALAIQSFRFIVKKQSRTYLLVSHFGVVMDHLLQMRNETRDGFTAYFFDLELPILFKLCVIRSEFQNNGLLVACGIHLAIKLGDLPQVIHRDQRLCDFLPNLIQFALRGIPIDIQRRHRIGLPLFPFFRIRILPLRQMADNFRGHFAKEWRIECAEWQLVFKPSKVLKKVGGLSPESDRRAIALDKDCKERCIQRRDAAPRSRIGQLSLNAKVVDGAFAHECKSLTLGHFRQRNRRVIGHGHDRRASPIRQKRGSIHECLVGSSVGAP